MRPLVLEVSALGPFAGHERIDFRELPAGALFLVTGRTGSGKTTLLDAITLALYGEASGGERDAAGLRSHLADPGTATDVTLDFAVGGDTYRVRRAPEQPRPKQRGTGVTEARKEATLWRLEGAEERVLATGWKEVTLEVQRLLGFSCAQFRQVVILPQGKFRDLLVADSREREAILEQLFETNRIRAIEEQLAEAADGLAREARDLWQQQVHLRKQLVRRLEVQPADDELPSTEEVAGGLADLSRQQSEADALALARTLAWTAAHGALEAGRRADRILRARAEARIAHADARRRLDEVGPKATQLAAALRAAPVLPLASGKARAEVADACARADREREAALAKAANDAAGQAAARLDELASGPAAEEREAAASAVTRLQRLGLEAAAHADAQARLDERERAAEAARAASLAASRRVAEAEQALQRVRTEAEAAPATGVIEAAQEAVDRAATRVDALRRLAGLREERAAAEGRGLKLAEAARLAETSAGAARGRLASLRRSWDEAVTARLAQALEAGHPCPVCGSAEHPAPAHAPGGAPTAADLERAEADVLRVEAGAREAAQALRSSEDALLGLRGKVEESESLHGGSSLDVEQAKADHASRSSELVALAGKARLALQARKEHAALEGALTAARQDGATSERTSTELHAAASEARGAVLAATERVPEEFREQGALERALRKAEASHRAGLAALDAATKAAAAASLAGAEAAARAGAAEKAATDAERILLTVQDEYRAALSRAGFTDAAAVQAAGRSAADVASLTALVRGAENAVATSTAALERAEHEAQALVPPDLDALERAESDVRSERDLAADRSSRLAERLAAAGRDHETCTELAAAEAAVRARHGAIGRVAEVARGGNPRKTTFHRFVLGCLLDEVLQVASERLSAMSAGRYALRRRLGPLDLRRSAGLDLDVDDAWTGRPRPVQDLSGGESFLAALALALGLAEVVQVRAGGRRLEALFVDEGFGSLDGEALQQAMDALNSLRRGGRLVGIVSHVSELRELVPCRLDVVSDRRGRSTARLVAG